MTLVSVKSPVSHNRASLGLGLFVPVSYKEVAMT